jgi:membrane protease YdiL (CAAX protease family)
MSEHMNPPETEQEKTDAQHRAELSGSIYTILFLVVTTYGLDRAFAVYLDRLVQVRQISRWTFLTQYVDIGMAVIFLAELIIVVCCYRLGPLRMTLRDMGLTFSVPKLKELLWGFLTGFLVYAASLPILLRLERHSGLTGLIIGNLYHPPIILVVVLFALLLPISCEIVFRGLIFKAFMESSSVVPAVLLSAFAFALVWPIYNSLIGLLLGIVTALLYHRFRNVLPAIVADAVLTIACAATLIYQRLY